MSLTTAQNNLFIIGNGFDLAHGLKTMYSHFREFLIKIEKDECAEAGEVSISDDYSLLDDDKLKCHFDSIAIPAMLNTLSETTRLVEFKDSSTGTAPLERIDEITQFLNDADKIVQWIKHGSGQYYIREKDESQAIKRFIAALEPKTEDISHSTDLSDTSAFWKALESEFGEVAVKFIQSGSGSDSDDIPLWLTLRLFIKMIDAVDGNNWVNLEASLGTNDFKMIFDLFKDLKSEEIYQKCTENYFTNLYYDIFSLLHSWIIYTEIDYENTAVGGRLFSELCPHIKKQQNDIKLSLTMKDTRKNDKPYSVYSQTNTDGHPMAKRQMLEILGCASQNYFITFNYTKTLERVYNISSRHICHIHGKSKGMNNANDSTPENIVFGHGNDSRGTNVVDVVSTAYNITKKPVNQCIINNQWFFDKLYSVNNIYSYGFSFGDVDMPYIEKICQSIHNTSAVTWHFHNYEIDENRATFEKRIRSVGFNGVFDVFYVN